MITLKSKYSKISLFLIMSILNNIFQLNGILSLPNPSLNKVFKIYLYNSYKNVTKFISLAQTTRNK